MGKQRVMRFFDTELPYRQGGQKFIGQATPAAQALALSEIINSTDHFILVITADSGSAEQLYRHLSFFTHSDQTTPVDIFPDWEILPYDTFSPHQDIVSQRLQLLYRLPKQKKGLLIIPVSTLLHRLAPLNYIQSQCMLLKKGDSFNVTSQQKYLTEAGYAHVETVYSHREFALRGSLMDIYPMGTDAPVRIDLFDKTIDSIRTFNPETQRTQKVTDHIQLLPAHEYPLTPDERGYFKQSFQQAFDVDFRDCPLYKDISKGLASAGAEYYLPLFFKTTSTLFDYIPQQTLLVTTGNIHAASEQFWRDTTGRYENYRFDVTRPLLSPEQILLTTEQLFSALKKYARLDFREESTKNKAGHYNLPAEPLPELAFNAKEKVPCAALQAFLQTVQRTLFVAESAGRREQLIKLLEQSQISPKPITCWPDFLHQKQLDMAIVTSPIDHGLWWKDSGIAIITESQLLGTKVMQRRRRGKQTQQSDQFIRHLSELSAGSPVVHLNHGVGRYEGLQTLNLDGQPQEFLTLTYADDAKLYVPVAHLHLIARYTGVNDAKAPLNKLGSGQWEKNRKKAVEKIRDVAAELLDVYARREAIKSDVFEWEETDYLAFADAFPFETTPDQQRAIDATLKDMAKTRPMDRLVCGDVGFGKTEVAMRAAFITLFQKPHKDRQNHQKQVAVLAPTTLLAQQHYETFCDRFADWPVRIEVLSRFKNSKQTQSIKQALAEGKIDIIIGTHKLLSEDVKFKALGLLVVDEEHRFGVQQKERMKAFRSHINILTLTATPIPRTLNMAMSSIRDLSIIATPPAKRLSINTFVHPQENRIIKEAVLRELLRGGQVYYLHNDVKTIEKAASDLQTLIPEARIAIGHGQMRERQLEQVMRDFYHKRTSVLVCTTIIETGIDIPNANTIIIQRADKFGLAQLHQLRGRVGRSHHQAYAYLLTPVEQKITHDAEKRLDAIASTTELGAGFMLATHDLEIRGAGELLGEDQSGQITSIGFSLYMDMLEKAVKSLKKGELPRVDQPMQHGTEINLHIPALIPEDYIASAHTRLVLYKRIASCENSDMLDEIKVEIIDRFGLLPDAVQHLFRVTLLKLKADQLGIEKIEASNKMGKVTFSPATSINPEALIALINQQPASYQLQGATALHYYAEMPDNEKRFSVTEHLLNQLAS